MFYLSSLNPPIQRNRGPRLSNLLSLFGFPQDRIQVQLVGLAGDSGKPCLRKGTVRQGRAGGNKGCYRCQNGQLPLHPLGSFAMPCITYARGVPAKVRRWVVCPPTLICYWWRAASRGMQQLLLFAKVRQLVSGRPVAEPRQ